MDSKGKVKQKDSEPGFQTCDLNAESLVQNLFKQIAKFKKSKFQSGLPTNIKEPEIGSLVPDLYNLQFQLRGTQSPKSLLKLNDTIWTSTNITDKAWTALLVSFSKPELDNTRLEGFDSDCTPAAATYLCMQRLESTILHLPAKDATQPHILSKYEVDQSM